VIPVGFIAQKHSLHYDEVNDIEVFCSQLVAFLVISRGCLKGEAEISEGK
jgi:hypothetical protein